jgi:MATE family multidrug resistance protein
LSTWRQRWAGPGGGGEVLRLAIPLIISNSFWTLQVTIDRVFLSQHSSQEVAGSMTATAIFWTCITLFQTTAAYSATFVAQYLGAGRSERIGPVVWQSLYFSLLSGLGFMLLVPAVEPLIALGGHTPELQHMEATFLRCLCFAALPLLLVASATSFYLGQGRNWAVLLVNATGLIVNAVLDYAWIFGNWGWPAWGIAGAGWATVLGAWASALLALALLFRPSCRQQFATLRGWRFDPALFGRLLWFGLPGGLPYAIEGTALVVVFMMLGWIGPAELSATCIAFSLNLLAFLPTMGIGQAVAVLVGRRLGENRPDLAARSAWNGFGLAWGIMTVIALSLVLLPDLYLRMYQSPHDDPYWDQVAVLVPILLRFVALYCLFDSMNLVFSFALKGAGDTFFTTAATLVLAWPIMVLPTWAAWYFDWGLYWSWASISAYVVALAFTFLVRFRRGRWKTMRVIENSGQVSSLETAPAPDEEPIPAQQPAII